MNNRIIRYLIELAILLLLSSGAVAQPYTLDEEIEVLEVTLNPDPVDSGGLWGGVVGTMGDTPQLLFVNNLSAKRAIQASLVPLNEGPPVRLEIAKNVWNDVQMSCDANPGESCYLDFQTFDDVGFRISGSKGSSWLLAVYTSPELDLDEIMPSPTFEASKSDAERLATSGTAGKTEAGEEGSYFLLMIIVTLLVVIVALLLLILKRNKGAVVMLVMGLVAVPMQSIRAENIYYGGSADQYYRPPPPGAVRQLDDYEAEAYRRQNPGNRTDTPYKDISAFDKRVQGELAKVNSRYKALQSMRKLAESWSNLSSCSNISNPPGAPRLPTFCEGEEGCLACYQDAHNSFNHVRGVLEQLRVVYKCTKDFTNDAIAFGDNVSGLHAVSGLAWQDARNEIQQSVKQLGKTYDKKHMEFIGNLENALLKMDACEYEYGLEDWYDRFGFFYLEFMNDKYRRID
ncbi:MAG TPA: hypothetical protein VJ984_16230 [Xanthomonadales bacterium]|nr:hypothetical protein [Xanthomonadales bacterium]